MLKRKYVAGETGRGCGGGAQGGGGFQISPDNALMIYGSTGKG